MRQVIRSAVTLLVALAFELLGFVPAQAAKPSGIVESTTSKTNTSETLVNQGPLITVWYSSSLNFGQIGLPQDQINILGNVSDPDSGDYGKTLTYSLNGKPSVSVTLGVGNDLGNPRLVNRGDFNINLYLNELQPGANSLNLIATDNNSGASQKTISFNYTPAKTWPFPYSTRWASAANISEQAQVTDGLWKLSGGGVRPASLDVIGYDRVIAIGDTNWTDYEILVPVTVHQFPVSSQGGVGIISRWGGHFPISAGEQPPTGWWNIGAYAYYSNRIPGWTLRMDNSTVYTISPSKMPFNLNVTYLFKLRSKSGSGAGIYSFKFWEMGTMEPDWNDPRFATLVNKQDIAGDPPKGSLLLVAHKADVTFGDVTVCPLSGVNYALNVSTTGSGTVSYLPSKQSSYTCGQGVTLNAQPATGWKFAGWSGGITSNSSSISFNMTKAYNLTATFAPVGAVQENHVYIPTVRR